MHLNEKDALAELKNGDLLKLGMAADALRRAHHPENVVTYALKGSTGHSLEEAVREAAAAHGAEAVMLADVSGVEHLSCDALVARLLAQQSSFPAVTFHHLPLSSLSDAHRGSSTLADAVSQLQDAGVRSMRHDIRDNNQAAAAPILHAANALGIPVHAVFTIGQRESPEQRVDIMRFIRSLQEETHALQSVLVRVHHASSPEARREEDATAVDYLKTLAVTRLFLDTVEHIQTNWSVMGPKVLELALRFGADDAGMIPRSQTGPEPSHHGGESELRRIIRDAGFRPVERDALFRQSLLH